MDANVIQILLGVLGLYLILGLVFAVVFVMRGVQKIDPAAVEGSWGFRLAILPGCVVFWPYLWKRWRRRTLPPSEWSRHRFPSRS